MKQWAEKKTSVFCTTVVTYKYAELWHVLAIFITTIREIEGLRQKEEDSGFELNVSVGPGQCFHL